jgi:hypothetical protein
MLVRTIKNNLRKSILKRVLPNDFYFSIKGYCPCCEKEVLFEAYHSWLRDFLHCNNCHSIPRERAIMLVIQKFYPDWKELKIHESSPGSTGASQKLRKYALNYLSSQYYPSVPFGSQINIHQNEDLENQTFNDSTFDLVVTQDVLEHVYAPEKAFREIARTLKKGGAHIFTVPLVNKHNPTEIWARKDINGDPIFLKKEEYHGNPVSEKGSPVTMHWGFDIIDFIKQESGLDTKILYMDDLDYGIRAEFMEVLISQK